MAGQINLTLASGKSPLHLAAERGDRRVLQLLLRARATLDATTSSGRTALHLAVEHDYEQAVQVRAEGKEGGCHMRFPPMSCWVLGSLVRPKGHRWEISCTLKD